MLHQTLEFVNGHSQSSQHQPPPTYGDGRLVAPASINDSLCSVDEYGGPCPAIRLSSLLPAAGYMPRVKMRERDRQRMSYLKKKLQKPLTFSSATDPMTPARTKQMELFYTQRGHTAVTRERRRAGAKASRSRSNSPEHHLEDGPSDSKHSVHHVRSSMTAGRAHRLARAPTTPGGQQLEGLRRAERALPTLQVLPRRCQEAYQLQQRLAEYTRQYLETRMQHEALLTPSSYTPAYNGSPPREGGEGGPPPDLNSFMQDEGKRQLMRRQDSHAGITVGSVTGELSTGSAFLPTPQSRGRKGVDREGSGLLSARSTAEQSSPSRVNAGMHKTIAMQKTVSHAAATFIGSPGAATGGMATTGWHGRGNESRVDHTEAIMRPWEGQGAGGGGGQSTASISAGGDWVMDEESVEQARRWLDGDA